MNIIFENRFYEDDNYYKEVVNKILFRDAKKHIKFHIITDILLLLFLLFLGHYIIALLFVLITVLINIHMHVYMPRKTIRQLKEDDLKLNNGSVPETVFQFGDYIISAKSGVSSLDVEYDKITRIIYTRNICALYYSEYGNININMNAFTIGTADEFRKFIAEKCPTAKTEYYF